MSQVHCIIFAKYLFNNIFGCKDEDSSLLEDLLHNLQIGEGTPENGISLFNRLFYEDIRDKKENSEEGKKFSKVLALKFEDCQVQNKHFVERKDLQFLQKTHKIEVYSEIFRDSFAKLMKLKREQGIVPFEKDDPDCMKFIASCTNIRSHVFNLPLLNEFEIKKIAGNIIPAIASTNSIVAAIEVTRASSRRAVFFLTFHYSNNLSL